MLDDTIKRRFAGAMAEVIAAVCSGTLDGRAAAAARKQGNAATARANARSRAGRGPSAAASVRSPRARSASTW